MATKLLNLIALSSLAVLLCASGSSPVAALSLDSHSHIYARHSLFSQSLKKRAPSKRCKARHPSANPSKSTKAAPAPTQGNNNGGGNNGGNNNPPPPPPPPNNSNRPRGKMCIATSDQINLRNFGNLNNKLDVIYTWSPWQLNDAKALGLKSVPMLWSRKQLGDFRKLVKAGYSDHVLAFNEPDHEGQSSMSPWDAAALWKEAIQPLKNQGYRLVSPACTNAPRGKQWMKDFLAACTGCTVDVIATHYYSNDADGLIAHLKDMHDTFGRNIWLTEFACEDFSGQNRQCNYDQTFAFMRKVRDFMDSQSWVEVYCPFGALFNMGNVNPVNKLIDGGSRMTDLARGYMSYA